MLLNLAPDHLDRHGTFEAYRAAKLRVFAHQGNDDVAVAPLGLGIEDLGGCARRVCFGDGPQAELADRAGQLWWADEPLIAVEEIAPARAAQPPQRDGGGGDLPGPRDRARRGARGPADLRRASSTASRRSRRSTACSTSTTPRRRTSPRRSSRSQSFDAPVHLILGGQGKGQDFAPLRAPVGRALRRRLPHRRGGRAHRRGRRRRALRDARARASRGRARPRGPARSCCCRPPARASTSSPTSRRAGGRFKELVAARRTLAPICAPPPAPNAEAYPLEYNLLLTATLCLLALGAVMVYSASSARARCCRARATGPTYLVRYLVYGARRAAWRCTSSRAAASTRSWRSTGPLLAISFALPGRGQAPGHRRRGQRRAPLARRRAAAVPALRDRQARARALRRRSSSPQKPGPHPHAARRRCRCCWWPAHDAAARRLPARPRHGARHRLHADGAARRRRACRCATCVVGAGVAAVLITALRAARALPARAADDLPRPVGARRRRGLPGGAGPDRARLGRAVRARPRRSRCRRSSTCPRPTPTSSSRSSARSWASPA